MLARRQEEAGRQASRSLFADELGRRLGLPVERVVVPSAGQAVELVRSGHADVGFFAVDPERSEGIAFSPPLRNEEVDRPGTRIAVGLGSAYDLFLSREIRQATLVRVPTSPLVVAAFLEAGLDVAAGVRQQLEADMRTRPGLRLLPGRFMLIQQAMGISRDRPAIASEHLGRFVEEMRSSGMVAAAVARHGIDGVVVAPPRGGVP